MISEFMGITTSMGLLKFTLWSIYLLAWPVLALGYPLCASIRAVETGSKNHTRKMVMYWTLFSLFSLFEFAFLKIIEWAPFWASVRVVVIFWLVMPKFEGACLAYEGFVRPFLLVKLQAAIDSFCKLMREILCKRETFLEVVIKENGSEALEKLIALEHERKKCVDFQRETTAAPSKQVYGSDEQQECCSFDLQKQDHFEELNSSARVLKGTNVDANVNKMAPPEESGEIIHPETPLLKKIQQEWTCDLCNVTTMSESVLNDHLKGSRHKSKLESLKASLLDAKHTRPSPPRAGSVSAAGDLRGTTHAPAEVKELRPPKETEVKGLPEIPLKKTPQEWTCHLCNVKTTAEITFNGHLKGSRHKSKLESLKASMLDAKHTRLSPPRAGSVSAAGDLRGTTHAPAEVKELRPPKETEVKGLLEIPLKKTPQEWTCDLCNVKTTAEITFNGHLKGSRHKSKLESLKASLLDAKHTRPSPPRAGSVSAAGDLRGTTHAPAEVKELRPPKETEVKGLPEIPLKKTPQEWTCDLCNVKTTAEITFNGHLKGSRHKSKLESLKASLLDAKHTRPSPPRAGSVSAAGDLRETTHAPAEVKELRPPKETEVKGLPEIPLKKTPQEWACDLCNVKTTAEITFNGHLKGSRHKSKLQSLKASLLDAKHTRPSRPRAGSVSAAGDLRGTTHAPAEVKELRPPKETEVKGLPEIPLKKTPQEWTCDLCNVKTTAEITFNGHLKGSRHKSKLESLKASLLDAKHTRPSPPRAGSVSAAGDLRGTTHAPAEVKELRPPKETEVKGLPEIPLKKTPQEWTCDLCNVKTTAEITFNGHLKGSRHKSKLESLKASLLDAKHTRPSPPRAGSVSAAGDLRETTHAPAEVKELRPPKETEVKGLPEIPLKKTPQEWACDLCNVKTTAEITFNGHLKGSRHKSKLQSLKASLLDAKHTRPSRPRAGSVSAAGDLRGTTHAPAEVKELRPPKETEVKGLPEIPLKKTPQEWACDLCNVKTTAEITFNGHLNGRKHKFKGACLASHFKRKRHSSNIKRLEKLEANTL